jgi:asparagine N-glycosylation enzyme membrane subunit Stt3
MKNIISSASKIVFLLLALTACVGFFLKLLESKDFMVLACMAFTFYFASKGDSSNNYLNK